MNNQISFRLSYAFLVEKNKNKYGTYNEGGKNYLFTGFNGGFMFNNRPFLCFLVPDDNSALANLVKISATSGSYFATSSANLQFKPDFRKVEAGDDPIVFHGLLIKDTRQIKKITEGERLPFLITFKVINQKKVKSETVGPNDYKHELEIEPLDLGIEGLPKITRLVFEFSDDPPGTTHP